MYQPWRFSERGYTKYCALIYRAWEQKTPLEQLEGVPDHRKTRDELREWELRHKVEFVLSPFSMRRFCSTSRSRLGWVPLPARPGDLVCIFDGAPLPFVLRPKAKRGLATRERSVLPGCVVSRVDETQNEQYELVESLPDETTNIRKWSLLEMDLFGRRLVQYWIILYHITDTISCSLHSRLVGSLYI